jgi:hypothetical protein
MPNPLDCDADGTLRDEMLDAQKQLQDDAVRNAPHIPFAARVLLRELENLECGCTLRERDSGHRTDCNMGAVREAAEKLKALLPSEQL